MTTLIAMISTVRIGKRRVGMLSFSGNTGPGSYRMSRNSIAFEKWKPGCGPPSMA